MDYAVIICGLRRVHVGEYSCFYSRLHSVRPKVVAWNLLVRGSLLQGFAKAQQFVR